MEGNDYRSDGIDQQQMSLYHVIVFFYISGTAYSLTLTPLWSLSVFRVQFVPTLRRRGTWGHLLPEQGGTINTFNQFLTNSRSTCNSRILLIFRWTFQCVQVIQPNVDVQLIFHCCWWWQCCYDGCFPPFGNSPTKCKYWKDWISGLSASFCGCRCYSITIRCKW